MGPLRSNFAIVTRAVCDALEPRRLLVGSITGQTFQDLDADLTLDPGEVPLAGVTVYIDENSNGRMDTQESRTVSNASGNFSFTNLIDGTYRIGALPITDHVVEVAMRTLTVSGGAVSTTFPLSLYRFTGTAADEQYRIVHRSASSISDIYVDGVFKYALNMSGIDSRTVGYPTFNLGDGDDTLTADYTNGTPFGATAVFEAGGTLPATGDLLNIVGGAASTTFVLADAAVIPVTNMVGFVYPNNGAIGLTGSARVLLDAGDGNDIIRVGSCPAGSAITINGGNGQDDIFIGAYASDPLSPRDASNVDGDITVTGGAGSDRFYFDDYGVQGSGRTYSITNSTVTRTGTGLVNYSQCETLTVEGAQGFGSLAASSAFAITSSSGTTIVNGRGSYVIGPNLGDIQGILALGFHSNSTIRLDDSAASPLADITYACVFGGITRTGGASVSFGSSNFTATVTGSTGNNAFTVDSFWNNKSLRLDGNDGNDTFSLPSALSQVTLDGGLGNDSITSGVSGTFSVTPSTFASTTYLNAESLTLNGSALAETITLTGTNATTPLIINGNDGNDRLTINGAPSSAVFFNGGGKLDTLDVNAGTYTFNTDARVGISTMNVNVGPAGAVNFLANQHINALTVNGIATMAALNGFLHAGSLSLGAAGRLDLADNDLIVDTAPFTTVQQLVLSGFGNGTGITSSTSDGSQVLALFDNSLVGATHWNGEPIPANAIVGKYTFFGDMNLDGQVTGDDYSVIDANLGTTPVAGLAWLAGDANLDGTITGDDYTVIDANLGLGAGSPLAPSREKDDSLKSPDSLDSQLDL